MSEPELDDRILRVLHGLAEEEDRTRLGRELSESTEAGTRFLDHLALHSLLIEEARAGSLARDPQAFFARMENARPATDAKPHRWLPAAAAAVLLGLAGMTALLWPARASAGLDQVLGAFDEMRDRSYRIEVLEEGNSPPESPERGRFPPSASLDGARLSLRGSRQFLLEQRLPNGEQRLIGSNGTINWSLRGQGPVRTSRDPSRFAGGLAGGRQEMAFLDLRGQLEELRTRYDLAWMEMPSGFSEIGTLKGLRGTRRSSEQGDAKEIEVWFEPESGLIHRLILNGLPRHNGGPVRLALILESDFTLPPAHFQHESHHEPGRQVMDEPSPP